MVTPRHRRRNEKTNKVELGDTKHYKNPAFCHPATQLNARSASKVGKLASALDVCVDFSVDSLTSPMGSLSGDAALPMLSPWKNGRMRSAGFEAIMPISLAEPALTLASSSASHSSYGTRGQCRAVTIGAMRVCHGTGREWTRWRKPSGESRSSVSALAAS